MDGQKPSPKSPEERVEDLLNRREREAAEAKEDAGGRGESAGPGTSTDPGKPSGPAKSRGPAPLTEKQRIEARRLRQEQRRRRGRSKTASRRPGGAGRRTGSGAGAGAVEAGGGNPLARGVKATGREIRRAAGFLFAALLAGLDRLGPFFSSLGEAASGLLAAIGRGLSGLFTALGHALRGIGALLLAGERQITPRRATFAIAGAGVIALGLSQFIDFRAIEVGRSGYSAVQEIARAPRVDVETPMDAHSVLLLAVAAIAAGCLAALALTGRRAFALGLSLTGVATVAVALLVDLPQGLDTEEAAIAFTGVAAVLLTGFWLQIAAGVVLAATGLLLAATGTARKPSTRTNGSRKPRETREPREHDRPEPVNVNDPRNQGPARSRSVRERPA